MKITILALIMTIGITEASIREHGHGFFPVMVQVVDPVSGTPIKGAKVILEDLAPYEEHELDPKRQLKNLSESLGKPVVTNAEGVAVVFYYGRWSSTTVKDMSTYSRSMACTVVVEHLGKEIYRKALEDWAEQNEFNARAVSVPLIVVSPPTPK